MVTTRYRVSWVGATTERPGSTRISMSVPRCRWADRRPPRPVLLDGGRRVARHVAHAQAAAEVVDAERVAAWPGRRSRRRTGPGRRAASRYGRAAPAGRSAARARMRCDGGRHLLHRHAELRSRRRRSPAPRGWPTRRRGWPAAAPACGVRPAARCGRCRRIRRRRSSRCARRSAALDVGVGLGVAVHDDLGGIGAGGQREPQFAGADDVAAQTLLDEEPDHRRGRVGLGRETDPAVRMPAGERGRRTAAPDPAAPSSSMT